MTGRKMLPGKPIPPSEQTDYSIDHRDSSEVFAADFLRRLDALNRLVREAGEALEGNVFYWDGERDVVGRPPSADLAAARRNLWRATRFKRRMLEIGVNAGHSALVALSGNRKLSYCGVDLAEHRYTVPCIEYLQQEFPGRVRLLQGDSRDVLPRLAASGEGRDFDIFHVDGGHTDDVCRADIGNCLALAGDGRGRHILIDDINASWIFDVYADFVSQGRLTAETFFGDWEDDNRNVLARIL